MTLQRRGETSSVQFVIELLFLEIGFSAVPIRIGLIRLPFLEWIVG